MKIETLRQSQLDLLLLIQKMSKDYIGEIVPLKYIIEKENKGRKPVQVQLSVQKLYESGWIERPVRGGYRLTRGVKKKINELLRLNGKEE